jgi:hypothetical protein
VRWVAKGEEFGVGCREVLSFIGETWSKGGLFVWVVGSDVSLPLWTGSRHDDDADASTPPMNRHPSRIPLHVSIPQASEQSLKSLHVVFMHPYAILSRLLNSHPNVEKHKLTYQLSQVKFRQLLPLRDITIQACTWQLGGWE